MFRHAVWTHGGGFARRDPKKLTLRWCGERSSPIRRLVAIWHASVYRGLSAALTRTKLSLLSTSEHEGGGKKLSVDTENTKSLIGDGDKKISHAGFSELQFDGCPTRTTSKVKTREMTKSLNWSRNAHFNAMFVPRPPSWEIVLQHILLPVQFRF